MPALRNIAIIAHVDHGKTTLVDAMLRQAGIYHANQQVAERVMDSNDIERERGITIFSKNASVRYGDVKINIVDTPGHADFGGEVERILRMVDGVILLVDAAEGPMPQTRFVLGKSLELGLKPIVVVNKVDRPDARIGEVIDEVLDLFIALGADDSQIDYPVLFGSGRAGYMDTTPGGASKNLEPLFKAIVQYIPEPAVSEDGPLQILVSSLDHSEFVGRQGIGRIERGTIRRGEQAVRIAVDGKQTKHRINRLEVFEGLGRTEVESASAGEIVVVAGIDEIDIGETVADAVSPEGLPPLKVDEPTLAVEFIVNDSPFAGREGKFVTSRHLRARLYAEAVKDRALRVSDGDHADTFRVMGRGELHLGILIEKMRREGYEFAVSRPEVLTRDHNGQREEPMEEVVVDVPAEYVGTVIERLGRRKGNLTEMTEQGDRTRLRFTIPTRGLIGFRTEFLSATRGEGVINHRVVGWGSWLGPIPQRQRGALVALEACDTVAYGLFQLEDRGEFFVGAGIPVYGGMIVGEYNKQGDLVVNVGKSKKLTNVRASGSDDAVNLTPPRRMSLENWLEFINDDELIEVTPESIRGRKKLLDPEARKRAAKKANVEA